MTVHSRSRKPSKKVKQLKRLLLGCGLVCLAYLVTYMILYGSGDAERAGGFLDSDINMMLYFIVGLCYTIYIAGTIRSYMLGHEYNYRFRGFWILGVVLTLAFLLLIIMNLMTSGADKPAEFMDGE